MSCVLLVFAVGTVLTGVGRIIAELSRRTHNCKHVKSVSSKKHYFVMQLSVTRDKSGFKLMVNVTKYRYFSETEIKELP